ncbi:GntR family transcriptional regulator / MocR family aminotransferase [Actinopolymorpha cephalotaxi]|uniref:GntR family transcriptional regulator / MocR family aminotransferase n=1 Tax=Actinopolymorpha cephalotaxi TaxID=504797 RepID=A0A1I2UBH1_9ACTN|nr:PLP-dependent aminotransferase family protein [Actinopolymorpha cephalotaxi]NYH86522.1 GntR family transcriptional regulator/MocR family aminotransferase [Actinopolymorpha cephalotaxi]SFG74525.1 GntR family transcriptional regulator / MocR family aminotransferase [Actinopolymorpha cephalotaxi]
MAITRAKLAWDTLLDVEGTGPLHERLTRALRHAIRTGRLGPGSALPPSRALAVDLGCSRWVVTQAYEQLVAEGYLTARTGSATVVRADTPAGPSGTARASGRVGASRSAGPRPYDLRTTAPIDQSPRRPGGQAPATGPAAAPATTPYDLAPGLPDLREFPRRRWAEAVRTQLSTVSYTDLGYPPPGGTPHLRQVLADYLRRCRGAHPRAGDLLVTAGVTDGVTQLGRLLRTEGHTHIGVEDPGWTRLREALERVGLEPVGIPVDADGLRVDALAADSRVRAVVVTPAHQFPAGVVLGPRRRAALLAWARQVDGIVLEDDYDAEFRYDRRPVGTLQGTDPDRVALLGSLSKTLSPAIGIGWLLPPGRWAAALRETPEHRTSGPPVIDQLALASFVETGGYDRHLRAARHRYRHRRDALVAALGASLPGCELSGVAAGLHLVLHLAPETPAATVVARAAAHGVHVADLDGYRLRPDPARPALVLGYGNLPDNAVGTAVTRLTDAIRSAAGKGQ